MTSDAIVFDATACWEFAYGSSIGAKLRRKYVEKHRDIHVSALALGELAARAPDRASDLVQAVRGFATVVPVSGSIAEAGGKLRATLRKADPTASLADAIHLATARSLGATLVSDDKAFAGEPDVEWP